MKIAFVLPHFYPYVGGGEKMFYDLALGLKERGHEIKVVARDVGEEYRGHKIVNGLDILYCPWKEQFGHPIVNKKDAEEAIKWCDIVHTSIFTTSPVVSKLARKYKKPAILTIYEVRGNKWFWVDNFVKAIIYNTVEQYACRQKFDAYHAISDATKKDIETFCNKKNVTRVYLANEMKKDAYNTDFSLREYFGLEENQKVFLYYGRPGQTKGVQVYEKAIEEIVINRKINPDYKFCFILGKEPVDLRKKFEDLIKKKGLTEYVLIKDSVARDQLSACIASADCVVVPSLTEGFGFSALEACQLGAKLIYSDGGSLPEVAYGTCKSFANRDYKDLADKLIKVMNGDEDAFDTVEEKTFTYDEMIGGIEALYKNVCEK